MKANDLSILIIAAILLAALISVCVVIVKLMLRAVYYLIDRVDWSSIGWNALGFAAFLLFVYGVYRFLLYDPERDRIRELTETERNERMMKSIENDCRGDVC